MLCCTDELFLYGDTDGIFMFENEIMKGWLKRFKKVPGFRDLVALNAMCRPDLFDRVYDYLSWNNPEKRKSCGIAQLDTILSETHGIILYRKEILSECGMPWMMQVCMLP